jgi:hypothetical protein
MPKKNHLGPQNNSRSSGPEELLKIVNCATIKETKKIERNNGVGPSGIGGWPPISTWNRETSLPFLEIVLRDSHILESPGRLKQVRKCQDRHLWSVGVVKETIGTETAPIEKIKREPSTMFNKLKQWRI